MSGAQLITLRTLTDQFGVCRELCTENTYVLQICLTKRHLSNYSKLKFEKSELLMGKYFADIFILHHINMYLDK